MKAMIILSAAIRAVLFLGQIGCSKMVIRCLLGSIWIGYSLRFFLSLRVSE